MFKLFMALALSTAATTVYADRYSYRIPYGIVYTGLDATGEASKEIIVGGDQCRKEWDGENYKSISVDTDIDGCIWYYGNPHCIGPDYTSDTYLGYESLFVESSKGGIMNFADTFNQTDISDKKSYWISEWPCPKPPCVEGTC